MHDEHFKIIIVGGGTAGWLSAAFLSQQLPITSGRKIQITLIEASDIPTIGVGEATVPSLRQTLAACGISEVDFLSSCGATFKHGIKFVNWKRAPDEDPGESYFHPFGEPLKVGTIDPIRAWSKLAPETRGNIADVFSVQSEMAEAGRAPKHLKDRPYDGALSYAYHLDAGAFADYLKQRFRTEGVSQIIGKVTSVNFDQRTQNINGLVLEDGSEHSADLYIDCTGFAARLINADKQNPFEDKNGVLFVDRAVTTRIEHDGIRNINGYTTCTAQTAGWIWDIVLQNRRGVGHVYSSKYIDDDTAKNQLADYLNVAHDEIETRQLSMRIGYHKEQWRGNCVAIGLASGFLEPLESTGIYLTEMANWALIDLLPRFMADPNSQNGPQAQFTDAMSHHYENIVDFLKLHYAISGRLDSDFWRDNANPDTWPNSLAAHLDAWRNDAPSVYDFGRSIQCFSANNYQFVLYGMGWKGHDEPTPLSPQSETLMQELSIRRSRLKDFVLRDTLPNGEFFKPISDQQ
ncbi:MAG: tryptophan 7-halogenase [Acidimicrobiales bacterium]|nr:tryptophan 7-halogenase [Hyphomonadaceae bacterium]RZV42996.1 MAG: tryptophan 7-halogenase [Acidimicrobiales bacterium]